MKSFRSCRIEKPYSSHRLIGSGVGENNTLVSESNNSVEDVIRGLGHTDRLVCF